MTQRHQIEEQLRQLDGARGVDVIDPAVIEPLRSALFRSALGPSPAATVRARNRMMQALVAAPVARPPLYRLASILPKSAFAAVAALVMSGGALTASAAAGGPNVPAILLGAIGIESPLAGEHRRSEEAPGGQLPDAAATATADAGFRGQEHRSDRANEAQHMTIPTVTPRPSGIAGSNASDTGREHANPAAVLGSENAQPRDDNRESRGASGDTPAAEHRANSQGQRPESDDRERPDVSVPPNGPSAGGLPRPELPSAAEHGQERAELRGENQEAGPPSRGRP